MDSSRSHDQFQCCFRYWIDQQKQDLNELLAAFPTNPTDDQLKLLIKKGIKHFEEYTEKRAVMAQHDASSFISPLWCTSFENACLWIGGCRPSIAIRLVYSVCGSELEAQLEEFLQGIRKGNLAEIDALQLDMINALQCNTIKEEREMSSRMASLQEEIADKPLAMIANSAGRVGEWSEGVEPAWRAHSVLLAGIMADADRLRMSTFKELMSILTPLQAVDLLIATKKLHLSMHEWGKTRDRHLGRSTSCSTPSS